MTACGCETGFGGGNGLQPFPPLPDKRLGFFDFGLEEFLVDGAVIDLPKCDPLAGQNPV